MTLVLSHQDVSASLSVDDVIATVRAGLDEQAAGSVQLPPRITVDSTAGYGWLRLMPAILNESRIMGFKAMHSTPGIGVGYIVMLYDLPTGELLAQLDADWLTAQRTAATAAVAADLLACKQIQCVGLLGSSTQARAMLTAVSRVRNLRRAKIYSPTRSNRTTFARSMSETLNIDVVPVDSAMSAVQESDLVLSAFRAGATPVVKADWLAPGTHVNAASSVRSEARELEDEVWRKCAVVAVDDRVHALESGDGRSALASGALRAEKPAELWEIHQGRRQGRADDHAITLFKSVGTALQDLALAKAVYDLAIAKGLGKDIGAFPTMRRNA
jgi:alanine dehydrogenase